MWVEFVDSCPCSDDFLAVSSFIFSTQKPTFLNSNVFYLKSFQSISSHLAKPVFEI